MCHVLTALAVTNFILKRSIQHKTTNVDAVQSWLYNLRKTNLLNICRALNLQVIIKIVVRKLHLKYN